MKRFLFIILCSFVLGQQQVTGLEKTKSVVKSFEKWLSSTNKHLRHGSRIAETPNGPIEYVIDGSGPAVLCLHGGFGGYDQGRLIGQSLAAHGFAVISPSRPGYLRTPLSVGQTIEQQADAMVALLDAIGIQQVVVLGFSAGAPVAFEVAIRHPDRVTGLVLECLGSQPNQAAMYQLVLDILKYDTVADFASWLFYLTLKEEPKPTYAFTLASDNSLSAHELAERIEFVLEHKSQKRFLRRFLHTTMPLSPRSAGTENDISNLDPWPTFHYNLLKAPTMIIQALADSNGSYPEAQVVASQIPGSQLVTVEQSGHFIWLGKYTHKWEKKLVRFVRDHQP
ncbi:MAG: alpha/beta hydrolase [Parachlamydiaceae bacterium]|nr:alpha/beta hydrolase [Parachlamydiaceae bacterium]